MRTQKITVLKTFYSNAKKADYVLGKNKTGALCLYKGFFREPLSLVSEKSVIDNSIIIRKYFNEKGKMIFSSLISKLKNNERIKL